MGNGSSASGKPIQPAVHPHVCGERRQRFRKSKRVVGSSPRLWGTGGCFIDDPCSTWFIPTSVGNGSSTGGYQPCRAVHPHVCGERVRYRLRVAAALRFIPTSVGNGAITRVHPIKMAVHPHVCGERSGQVAHTEPGNRFIPTSVGNGGTASSGMTSAPVHPHVCGERASQNAASVGVTGSSPRLWGTDRRLLVPYLDRRFIPTSVGNGLSVAITRDEKMVHPHVCGERAQVQPLLCRYHRFIPTSVGNGSQLEEL